MLYEFALEPSLLHTWQNVRFYMGKFGVEHGRLISRYPKRWEQMVLASLPPCGPVERLRIVEALKLAKDRLLSRHHEWDDSQPWLENAEAEHARRPFHAIVATSNPRALSFILLDDDIDEPGLSSLWQSPRSQVIQRQAAAMALAVSNLLRCSRTVLFVDRNFTPKLSRYRLPLQEFLLVLHDQRTGRPTANTVQYHVGVEQHDAGEFKRLCQAWLPDHVPTGMRIEFVLWRPDDLHNRYVITDRGAIQFGEGLDQAGSGGRTDDVVSVLDQSVTVELMQGFAGSPPKFTLVDRLWIVGTRTI